MKTIFNLFLAGILILGTIFLYGSFKKTFPEKTVQTEVLGNENVSKNSNNILDGWNFYENNDYQFSLQYPEDWKIKENSDIKNKKNIFELYLSEEKDGFVESYLLVQVFDNSNNLSLTDWWNNWLTEEDKKEEDCKSGNQGEAPCLFLRDLVQGEKDSFLRGYSMKIISLFQFDSSRECNYVARGNYIYGICYDGENPNISNFEKKKNIITKIFSTFSFE